MSFIFSQVNGSAIGDTAPDIGAGSFYSSAFSQGLHDSMLNSIYRMSEYHQTLDEDPFWNPRLTKEDANHFAQQQGVDLKFDYDPTQDEVSLMIRRHLEQRDRDQILTAGATGVGRTAGQIGVQFLGSVLNPLDLPLMFVPVVGTSTKVQGASKLGQAISRGIVTEEALATRGLALRGYTAAVIEGSVGQAITEIPLMFANIQDQTDYTAQQFFGNIALGGVFGAGVKTAQKVLKAVGRAHSRLTPETRENMATGAMDDFIRGETIDPARFVDLDNTVVKSKASESMDQLGYPVDEVNTTRVPEGPNIETNPHGWGENVVKGDHNSKFEAGTIYSDQPTRISKRFDIGDNKYSVLLNRDNPPHVWEVHFSANNNLSKTGDGAYNIKQQLIPAVDELTQMVLSKHPEAIFRIAANTTQKLRIFQDQLKKAGFEILPDGNHFKAREVPIPSPEQRAATEKEAVESFKSRDEAKVKQKETTLQREIEEGQTLKQEEIVRFGEVPTEIDLTRLEQEIRDLEDQLSLAADEWEANMDALEGNVGERINISDRINFVQRQNKFETDYPSSVWNSYLPKSDQPARLKMHSVVDALSAMGVDRRLFDELFEIDPELKDIQVSFDPDLLRKKGAVGMYSAYDDFIVLNSEVSPKTIFHELVHATAVRRWREDLFNNGWTNIPIQKGGSYLMSLEEYAKVTKNRTLGNLVKLYISAVKHHKARIDSKIHQYINHDAKHYYNNVVEPHYGLLNFDEFIAEAISNRQFQFYLNTIPGSSGKTVFSEFISKIKEFFGMKDKQGTLLDETLSEYRNLIEDGPRSPQEYLKSLRKTYFGGVTQPMIERASTCILNGQA